jgi:CubicO group peptidase (beta-lactamase class C family)
MIPLAFDARLRPRPGTTPPAGHRARTATAAQADPEARVREILGRHPAVGFAVGIVRDGSLDVVTTHGSADLATGRPIDTDTVFRVGSITKTFTAVAVLRLVEQRLVELDEPVDRYLRTFRLVPAEPGWPPVTLRQLLTHTSGIGEVRRPADLLQPVFGELVRPGRRVPRLAEYYRRGLRVGAEPGTRWRYSGHNAAVAGQVVEDVMGQPLADVLRELVFAPSGMADTELVPSPRLRARLARGYTIGRRGVRPVPYEEQVTTAAGGAVSTLRDLARYAAALLAGGRGERGAVVQAETVTAMFAPQYRPDPRIPGMGLAFFRGEAGGHRVVEHGGVMPDVVSQLCLAPDDGVAVVAYTTGARRPMFWLPGETAGLLHAVLGVPEEAVRTDVPHSPEVWGELTGRYVLPGPFTDARARGMAGAGVDVVVRGGRLVLRVRTVVPAAYRGFPLYPDDPHDPYVFRLDLARFGIGSARVVFSRAPAGVHVDRGQFLSAWKAQP